MNNPWPVHTLVLDLDDTLYPEREFVAGGIAAADAWLATNHGKLGLGPRAQALFDSGRRGRIFDEALPQIGLAATAELVAQLVAAYREHEPKLSLFPDAAELLGWATGKFRLALITDGLAAVQQRKIRALGLETSIPCRIVTDELGREHWKPSPEPYRRVMAKYPGPVAGYVYVADNPRKDFIGARALGWRTIRIRRHEGEHSAYTATASENADTEVKSLAELRGMLLPKTIVP